MKILKCLNGKAHTILIDDSDIKLYQRYTWYIINRRGRLYVRSGNDIYLHRLIMRCPGLKHVDHINLQPLDNRKCNLRLVSIEQNNLNRGNRADQILSIYKGVAYARDFYRSRKYRWVGRVRHGKKSVKKYFATESEAAQFYNDTAKKIFGEYAFMNKIDFQTDLKFGNDGEEYFWIKHRTKLTKLDGRKADLIFNESGDGLELKTDRSKHGSRNLFLERHSHRVLKTPGGPYKALENETKYFVYFFLLTDEVYVYETTALINFLEANKSRLRYHEVNGSNSTGYIVPVTALRHLELKMEDLK